ncbi:MAG: ATP-dependent RNA helicase HrpA [Proteobacteria bacterium]|nr:ATP-dependent RNA helicase HrpA [Pseudomonadota bacterium]
MSDAANKPRTVAPIDYPAELPVVEHREEIMRAIAANQVLILAGETGSGKTTQLPKICLDMGRGREAMIAHTQPRRLAARTVAQRIAEELNSSVGEVVGFQVRFTDKVSDNTCIKLMTDGILLAEIQRDRLLRKYDTIIIDEAHERSLNIDFLLGYLKRLLPQRPDLKLIITSATIDVESFSRHFDKAPVIEVSGRTYPVETLYMDPVSDRDQGVQEQINSLVAEIDAGVYGKRGDILIFLSGERDIRELAKLLRTQRELEVLPLYARLSHAEQNRVFDLSKRRGTRVVLATNVAETSLTVPGIRYVIDPGEARISRYSFRTKIQRLPIEAISQASANQRKGRCGRMEEGVCLRLYSEEDFSNRPEFTDPEIRRTNLAAVILQMLLLRLGDIGKFPFINPPDPRMVRDGYKLLEELGAVTVAGELTAVGRKMARLPVDPRMARMVLAATEQSCLEEMLVITSALAVQDPRERPAEKQQQSDQMHARFKHEKSDFMAWINLWKYYEEQRQSLSQNQLRKLCKREFLSYMRMREWRDIHYQLTLACKAQKIKPRPVLPQEENYEGIHKALLAGLLSHIAQFQEGHEYLGSRNRKLQIFPGSSQFKKKPKWMVAAEIVETSKVYARSVAAIDPLWVLGINPDLLKYHYYQPRWQARSGRVMAYERITLYGLTVSDKQSVHFGPINPVESRELLIREGLIAANFHPHPGFLKHNQRLVRELEDLEARTRRRDILADERVLFAFYDERLPADIFTANRLRSWLKQNAGAEAGLRLVRETLLAKDLGSGLSDQFPNQLEWQDMRFKLSYQFEPGKVADGVSVTVPVALLNRVPRFLFDWLVPGLLREKCIQLIRGLPKAKRKHLVPAPDFVDRALTLLSPHDADLVGELSACLSKLGGIPLATDDWDVAKLDDYYRMNIRVVDAQGKLLEQGRDLAQLISNFRTDTRQSMGSAAGKTPAKAGMKRWDFGDIPREWRFRQAGVDIVSYPGLVDKGACVDIELFDYPSQALLHHRHGLLRLTRLHSATQVKYLGKQMLTGNKFTLVIAGARLDRGQLLTDLIDGAYSWAMKIDSGMPFTEEEFTQMLQTGKGEVIGCANELEKILFNTLGALAELRREIGRLAAGKYAASLEDCNRQLQGLLLDGFVRDTPHDWLAQYPRYMKALVIRIQRLNGQAAKDQKYTELLEAVGSGLWTLQQDRPGLLQICAEARQYRWMMEEFRVSLFAQSLGTRQAISEKRLQEQWLKVSQWVASNPH